MMNGTITLKNLADLGQFADRIVGSDVRDEPIPDALVPPSQEPFADTSVEALVTALDKAKEELRALAEMDAHAREAAASAVATYRKLDEAAVRLHDLIAGAEETVARTDVLAANGLDEACRRRAERLKTGAAALASSVRRQLETTRAQIADVLQRSDVRRLLEEEQRAAQAAAREAEERRRQEELRRGLEQAEALIAEGNENEARRLLGVLAKEHPNSPEPASSIATLERRAQAVKCDAAERALRQARSLCRRAPEQAIAHLGPLDLDGLPDPLVRQVYGCWLAACRRLPLNNARVYSPRFGRGAIMVPADDGQLAVASAIGLSDWTPGRCFAAAALRGARSL
jgi:hypothetical protein